MRALQLHDTIQLIKPLHVLQLQTLWLKGFWCTVEEGADVDTPRGTQKGLLQEKKF